MITDQGILSHLGSGQIGELKGCFGRGKAEEPGHWGTGKQATWAVLGLLVRDKQRWRDRKGCQEQEGH